MACGSHARSTRGRTRLLVLALSLLAAAVEPAGASRLDTLPIVTANDNRAGAGTLRRGTLEVRLVVTLARWYPEGADGPVVVAPAFAEEGGAPLIPGPLIRVPTGTMVAVSIRNALADSTLRLFGLGPRPVAALDSVVVPPGEVRTVRFRAGAPGSYLYFAEAGAHDPEEREREQLSGALVVDAPGPVAPDRVFVINLWGEPRGTSGYRNALAINGRSWPQTERIDAVVGDTLRWRVLNASRRNHPMHLHGFYFRVDARGSLTADTVFPAAGRRLAVTEELTPGATMRITWTPDRPGNWLFHCHLAFHVVPGTRLEPPDPGSHEAHAQDAGVHMAGLVLGISVRAPPDWTEEERPSPRALHLWVNEGRPRGRAPRALGFVLQRDRPPAPDSVEVPGSTLLLTRGEATDITVVNRLAEPTAVHWHGIELESFSDGVAGWSGADDRIAPVVAPGDSFTARLTLPRAGTFIYHTHLNDIEQLTAGLYGAIIVLEPGERFDPARDHLIVIGWDGRDDEAGPPILVNGGLAPEPVETRVGATHRVRVVNIGPAAKPLVALRQDTTLLIWRPRAKDGADLPIAARFEQPASVRAAVGETYDFEFTFRTPGEYTLGVGPPNRSFYRQSFLVR
ncbi:MAG TPA: multicopper oxidase domain-containing protein [Longimicrobiales bacterium]|nr:multicopper oxidase domain-containing protein [Longimicrobiales bacterium]